MTTSKVQPIPAGMHTVTPHLICAGAAEAIEFYKKAFNAVEVLRMPGSEGKLMHAHIRIGDSAVLLVDEMPEWGAFSPRSLKGSPVTIHLYVQDVDVFTQRAVAAGAKSRCLSKIRSGAIVMASLKIPSAIIGRWRRMFVMSVRQRCNRRRRRYVTNKNSLVTRRYLVTTSSDN